MQTFQHYCNRLVHKLNLPPSLFGYRYLPADNPEDCVKRERPTSGKRATFRIVDPERIIKNPYPCNIEDPNELNSQRYGNFPLAFSEVPLLKVRPSWTATIYDCLILRYRDEWKKDFYAIVSSDKRSIAFPGVGYRPEHAQSLSRSKECRNFEKGTWIFGMWYRNYFLWLTTYLSCIMLAVETDCADDILFPGGPDLSAHNIRTIEKLKIPMKNIMPYDEVAWHVDKLTLVYDDPFDGNRLREFQEIVTINSDRPPWRKVFISREKAQFRRLVNQDEIWPIFKRMGWQKVCMEDLPFDDQIKLMNETKAFAGVHGAGFGNIIFCQKGTHVLEVSCYGNASFYALACTMGHHYWLEKASFTGTNSRETFDDVVVDPHAIETVLKMIESRF